MRTPIVDSFVPEAIWYCLINVPIPLENKNGAKERVLALGHPFDSMIITSRSCHVGGGHTFRKCFGDTLGFEDFARAPRGIHRVLHIDPFRIVTTFGVVE